MDNRQRLSRAFVVSSMVVVVSVIGVASCMEAGSKSSNASKALPADEAPESGGAASTAGEPRPSTDAESTDTDSAGTESTGTESTGTESTGTEPETEVSIADDSVTVSSEPVDELTGNAESDDAAAADLEAAASDSVPQVPVSDQRAKPYVATGRKSGSQTKRVQIRLLELGFWLNGVTGRYGLTTRQALFAFQKWAGLKRTGEVDDATAEALTNATHRAHASIADGTLVEIDETKQLFFLISEGRTMWVLNTSTGTGEPYSAWSRDRPGTLDYSTAVTPNGVFTVYRQKRKGWWWGDLGKIYRPKYFSGGVAIHGMDIVPPQPASHGCVRLSLPAMDFIWDNDLVPLGSTIWVHGNPKAGSTAPKS
ncbi:MAG: hypothetical protein RL219_1137 [Actinomycetota bacterium]